MKYNLQHYGAQATAGMHCTLLTFCKISLCDFDEQAFVLGEDFFGVHSKFFIRSGEVRPLLLSGAQQLPTIHVLMHLVMQIYIQL
jgi:hypothetical protein